MPLTPEQLEMRRTGLGGSETPAIFGLHPFKKPFDLYVGKTDGWATERSEDMKRGDHMEAGVANWYAENYGVEVVDLKQTLRHATRPLILATPDRLINTPSGETELLSIKNPRNFEPWGEDETQGFPMFANIQVQQEAAVLKSLGYTIARAWVAAPIWGDLRRYPVRLDEELQERLMSGAEKWWAKHVATKTPPPIDASEGARRWLLSKYPTADGKAKLEATLEQEALAQALRDAEAAHDAATEALEAAKARVIESMGSAYGLKGNFGTVTYFDNKWSKRTFRARWSTKEAANGQ